MMPAAFKQQDDFDNSSSIIQTHGSWMRDYSITTHCVKIWLQGSECVWKINFILAFFLSKQYLFINKTEEATLVHSSVAVTKSNRPETIDSVFFLHHGTQEVCTCPAKWISGLQGDQNL